MDTRGTLIHRVGVVALVALLVGLAGGCSTDTEMNGVRIPNAAPDTRVTGQPPTLLEASYAVEFRWTGADPDGRIRGYQWKMSDNGTDGIGPQDTLTVDPLTGAVLHPWSFTAATDSVFLVLADQPDFPGDGANPRSFRSHSLFVRAIDDKGAVDPTPAYISFTSTTIVPTSRAVFPIDNGQSAVAVPSTVTIGWEGSDPDFDLRVPVRARYLWLPAMDDSGNWIQSEYQYSQHYHEILSFNDPGWSPWLPYLPDAKDRRVSITGQALNEYYLFATQTQDTAGAVSVDLRYRAEVLNVVVRGDRYSPSIKVNEPYLGLRESSEAADDIAGGQPLNFSWIADSSWYNGTVVSMQHGWDLIDPSDPNDPGWAVPPGLSEQNRRAAERSFNEGLHTFVLRVVDDSNQVRVFTWTLRVVPFVNRAFQLPLLVIDQLYDRNSTAWSSRDSRPLNDQLYRNAYWHFLAEGAGGVADFNWDRDRLDHSQLVNYDDIVGYKAVLCYARTSPDQTMFSKFRPIGRTEQFVWLTPYQRQGGNFMLVGAKSMDSFLQIRTNYMVPIIFDTREETYTIFGQSFIVGFGTLELPDGTRVQRGPRMYPFATAGIAALDYTSPTDRVVYGRTEFAGVDRNRICAGLKGIVLSPDFKNNHLVGPGVIPDTMYTDPEIDWRDQAAADVDTLNLLDQAAFVWDADEFVDANISTRTTQFTPQACAGEDYANANVPNGLCIEPMFTGIARLDWMREMQWARGRTDWPQSRYTDRELDAGCGTLALTEYQGRTRTSARTNGRTFGYLSYKMVPSKPFPRADVYWGFDPYRFDHEGTRKAIRWVLDYFGLQINQ